MVRVIESIVAQHAEGAAFLWHMRSLAVAGSSHRLVDLARLDERLLAHLEGLTLSGEVGRALCEAQLGQEPGEWFVAAVLALEAGSKERLESLLARAEPVSSVRSGILSALGWVGRKIGEPAARELMAASSPWRRALGLAALALHRVDPGGPLRAALEDADAEVRARALRAAGQLGRRDLVREVERHLGDSDERARFWAAWSEVLLGDRRAGLDALERCCLEAHPMQSRALALAPRALEPGRGRALLAALGKRPEQVRAKLSVMAGLGDPQDVPALLSAMREPATARLAGEAFAAITGCDLERDGLLASGPPAQSVGPSDDPADEQVALDPDEPLPWPDPDKVERWWGSRRGGLPAGKRLFYGMASTEAACKHVLRERTGPARIAASVERTLFSPGVPLFEWRAPARRQQVALD